MSEFPPLGSPSLSADWAIEFLRQQAEMLARTAWPAEPAGAISPFWIEDVLAIGDVLWPEALERSWQELSPSVVQPKLLVVHAEPVTSADSQSLWQRVAVAVHSRASRRGVGPLLGLDFANPDAAELELIAAVESMN